MIIVIRNGIFLPCLVLNLCPAVTLQIDVSFCHSRGLHGSDFPQPSAEIFSNFPNLQFL